MNKTISKPLTLSGRYFSKKELLYVQQTVHSFPKLSLTELAKTLCEHLNWVTARGRTKLNACLTALDKLENDILRKTDGCATTGAPDNNDKITDCDAQGQVYPQILVAIDLLRAMVP